MIPYNTLIAFECLDTIQSGNKKCKQFCAYKLDLTKAYDRVIEDMWEVKVHLGPHVSFGGLMSNN
jgi:hypothetical protein